MAPVTDRNVVRMSELVFPNDTNHLGTYFGGRALSLMDMAAFVAATRHCRKTVVTASSERIDFRTPVRQGMLVEVEASVAMVGRSSMKVQVDLYAEHLLTGQRDLCTSGFFTMVALDDTGKPTRVPPLADS